MFTVLFGAGADQDYCNAMPAGNGFTQDLLKGGFFQERKVLLGDEATRYRLLYPSSIKCFMQTIVEHKEEARKYMTEEEINIALWYCFHDADDDDKNGSVRMEDVRTLCNNLYSEIMSEQPSNRGAFILSKALFFDALDEKFNSLRKSPLDGNGLRVVNAYYTVFLLMIRALYYDTWNHIKADQKTHEWLFDLLKQPYEITKKDPEKSYYHVVSGAEKCFVATSNYTKLAENELKLTSGDRREIAYLHGKLTWFEDLEKLIIYDVENELDLERLKDAAATPTRIIPFILIPSGVKPIICRKQIDEYAKFAGMLDQSKKLCIMGYGLNSEDNHISAMIAKWLGDSAQGCCKVTSDCTTILISDH